MDLGNSDSFSNPRIVGSQSFGKNLGRPRHPSGKRETKIPRGVLAIVIGVVQAFDFVTNSFGDFLRGGSNHSFIRQVSKSFLTLNL